MEVKIYLRLNEIGWEAAFEVDGMRSFFHQTVYSRRMLAETAAATIRKHFKENMSPEATLRVFVKNGEQNV